MAEYAKLPWEKPVEIEGSMGKLFGLLGLPKMRNNDKCPMVIFCHGLKRDLDFPLWPLIIEKLNQEGIGSLRFDFNGRGKSEGKFSDMTALNEIDDLLKAIAWTRSLPHTSSIALVGHSQGGVVAGMTAGQCGDDQIAALVLLSAAGGLRDDVLKGNFLGATFDPWNLDQETYSIGGDFNLGRAYLQSAMTLPIYKTTGEYEGETLVVNGMADQVVPYTYAERFRDELLNAEITLIPGENHAYSVNPGYAADLVANWLIDTLPKSITDVF